jgi:hypothetical protein
VIQTTMSKKSDPLVKISIDEIFMVDIFDEFWIDFCDGFLGPSNRQNLWGRSKFKKTIQHNFKNYIVKFLYLLNSFLNYDRPKFSSESLDSSFSCLIYWFIVLDFEFCFLFK